MSTDVSYVFVYTITTTVEKLNFVSILFTIGEAHEKEERRNSHRISSVRSISLYTHIYFDSLFQQQQYLAKEKTSFIFCVYLQSYIFLLLHRRRKFNAKCIRHCHLHWRRFSHSALHSLPQNHPPSPPFAPSNHPTLI